MNNPPTGATIQQLNLGYDAVQDRLLFKLGLSDNTEFAVWLTRRLVKGLWDILQKNHAAPLVAPDIFTHETQPLLERVAGKGTGQQAVQSMDFSEEYQPDRALRTAGPLLLTGCQLAQGGGQAVLELQSESGTMRIPLTPELSIALGNMLQMATREAGWDLHLVPEHTVLTESARRHILH